jgi:hypothetical protein
LRNEDFARTLGLLVEWQNQLYSTGGPPSLPEEAIAGVT